MSRDLSRNERRLAALGAIGLLWGALLVAVGLSVLLVVGVLVVLLLVAAAALQGRALSSVAEPRLRRVWGRLRGATATASSRLRRIDWTQKRNAVRGRTTAAVSAVATRGQTLRRDLAAKRPAQPAAPNRRDALRLAEQAAALRSEERLDEALEQTEQALVIFRRLGDRHGEALTLNGLGLAQARSGDEAGALDSYEAAVAILTELGDAHGAGRVLANLGALHRGQGHEAQARAAWNDALERLEPGSPEHDRTAQQLKRAS